jgi:hypothetical protein
MIDIQRSEVLQALEELSEACPEYRLGQMIANLAMLARGDDEGAIWNMEDAELLAAARKHLADWNARHEPAA